ncbi:MAG: hypothetical protein Q4C53_07255 [Clostridia bacterium]|nr:hypothetical protein [Clostridia bacterium]
MKASVAHKIDAVFRLPTYLFVTALGLVFAVLTFLSMNQKIPENYVKTQAVIERIEEYRKFDDTPEHEVYIGYRIGDAELSDLPLHIYDSTMQPGGTVEIYVDPDMPDSFILEQKNDLAFVIISGVLLVIGVTGTVRHLAKFKKK